MCKGNMSKSVKKIIMQFITKNRQKYKILKHTTNNLKII